MSKQQPNFRPPPLLPSSSRNPQQNPASKPSSFGEAFAHLKSSEHFTAALSNPLPAASAPPQKSFERPPLSNPNSLIASEVQRKNPILRHVKNVPIEYGDIVPDFLVGPTSCVLYISIRFYKSQGSAGEGSKYLTQRMVALKKHYKLRILLCQVDEVEPLSEIQEITLVALQHDCTILLAWSGIEAARYLETLKAYENKPADLIMEKVEQDHMSIATDVLTEIRSVNKTDVLTLLSSFGSMKSLANASIDELSLCPGVGPKKVKRIFDSFNQPFFPSKEATAPSSSSVDRSQKQGRIEKLFSSSSSSSSAVASQPKLVQQHAASKPAVVNVPDDDFDDIVIDVDPGKNKQPPSSSAAMASAPKPGFTIDVPMIQEDEDD